MSASTVDQNTMNSVADFLPPTQAEINESLQHRLRELEEAAGFDSQGAAAIDPYSTCDDPDCGCHDDEGVVGGIFPETDEPTTEDVRQGIVEISQVGVAVLEDVALNSENDMAAVEAANSLIGWGQVAAEKIEAIERDALIMDVEEILNSIIDSGETAEQDENAVGSQR